MEVIIVSIGALAKNPLWNERVAVRTSHATTTLIRTRSGEGKAANILVDPSLPGEILDARLDERAGIRAKDITHVFLTNWRPVHRRGLEHFSEAAWLMHEKEMEAAAAVLEAAEAAQRDKGGAADEFILKERALLRAVKAAPDSPAEGVDLFPLFGYTPGQCGLLVSEATRTTIIAGDAVPTGGHFLAGQVFGDSYDIAKAKDSLVELYEIADVIVPGHDNYFLTPRGSGG